MKLLGWGDGLSLAVASLHCGPIAHRIDSSLLEAGSSVPPYIQEGHRLVPHNEQLNARSETFHLVQKIGQVIGPVLLQAHSALPKRR